MNSSASAAMNSSRTATIGNGYVREDVDDVQHVVGAQVHAANVVLVPVSACAPARALSCTSACVPEGLPADLPTPVGCMHSSARDCVRACNTNTSRHARKHLQRRSAERKTLNCQLYIGSASFCMCGRN